MRRDLYTKVAYVMPEFSNMDNAGKFVFLTCNENPQILTWVGKFLYNAFEQRNKDMTSIQ